MYLKINIRILELTKKIKVYGISVTQLQCKCSTTDKPRVLQQGHLL